MSEDAKIFMSDLFNTRATELGLDGYRPENYYRIIGSEGDTAVNLYRDVQRTGQIRGTPAMGMSSFFSKGLYQPHYGYSHPNNINYLIEATPAFNPDKNPLYKPNSSVTYRPTPKIGGIPFPSELAFPDKGSGSRWITDVKGTPAPVGTYSAATPIENPSFWQRVNPANQYGLKMSSATISSPNVVYTVQPNEFGKHEPITVFDDGAPRWKTKFDYTKPFSQTSIPQHGKNLVHIGKTVLAQPETKAVISAAGDATVKAGGVASLLMDVPENYYTADKKRKSDARNAAGANWYDSGDAVLSFANKPATLQEKLSMAGSSIVKSVANAVTLGSAYAGTGDKRPKRGLGEMEKSTDEMYRTLKERGDRFLKQGVSE